MVFLAILMGFNAINDYFCIFEMAEGVRRCHFLKFCVWHAVPVTEEIQSVTEIYWLADIPWYCRL